MRSELSWLLKSAFTQATGKSTDNSRRKFIKTSAMATLALSIPFPSCVGKKKPTIAIVGGGIAGMTTSYHLDKLGIANTIYEATGRTGGRVLTVENAVVDGAHVDFGAEFIDSTHQELLSLSKEWNVELVDLFQDKTIPKAYYFEGKIRTEQDVLEALKPFAEQLEKDANRLPDDLHFNHSEQFKDLDDHSVTSYLQSIGMDGWLKNFFEMAVESEYGMNALDQSAVNLLVMFSTPFQYSEHYHVLGSEHEVMKFKGGTQRFIDALNSRVDRNVKYGYQLKKITQKDSEYELVFNEDGKSQTITADYVVMAIPPTVLRTLERNFKFNDRKEKWLAEVDMGNAVKVAMGFKQRVWRDAGFSGYTFNDITDTVFWDSSLMSGTTEGSLTFDSGGDIGNELATKSYEEIKAKWLTKANEIYPGLTDAYNGRISKFVWQTNPFSKGSYSCYKPGQWSAFAGIEAEPHENMFFAGEHCSVEFQGFMNGAAETGRNAAVAISNRIAVNNT